MMLNKILINKKINNILTKKNVFDFMLRALLVALPFLSAIIISFFLGYGGSLRQLIPFWNDEVWWFTQIEAVVKYGQPLGYYMYNEGSPAAWGNWGPWGAAPLFPYALFGKIFGWNLNSMGIANLTFLSISLLVLVLLAKPDNKQVVILGAVYLTSFVTVGYSITSMSEGLRYSCAIILTAIIIRVERCTNASNDKLSGKQITGIILCCVSSILIIQINIVFALCVFVLSLLILRRVKFNHLDVIIKLVISFALTAVVGLLSYKLYSLTKCPYAGAYLHEAIINTFKNEGLYKGFVALINSFIVNISTMSYSGISSVGGDINADMWIWTLIAIIGVFFFNMQDIVLKKVRNVYSLMSAFFVFGVVVINSMLYSSFSWGIRVENIGLIMALILLVFSERYKHAVNYALLSVFCLGSAWTWYSQLMSSRNSLLEFEETLSAEKAVLSEVIKISPDNDAWENTVTVYNGLTFWTLSLPAGAGSNFMLCDNICTNTGYAVMPPYFMESYREGLEANGYSLIHSDDVYSVFHKE